jgi:hypothetical protein
MNYNTSKEDIVISEYGRNIQELIQHAKTIEDGEHRQAYIEEVVNLMQQLHPQAKNVDDYIAKLWSHVFRIADYDLDVTPPCEILPKEELYKRPEMIPYPSKEVRYRHYGKNVQEMIKKASEMEDEDVQEEYVNVIGSYMKMAFQTWNHSDATDKIIRRDLNKISKGELELDEDADIDGLVRTVRKTRRTSSPTSARRKTPGRTSSTRKPTSTRSKTTRTSPINKRRRK